MKRLLAFGDIHGCADTIKSLIKKVGPTEEDTLVFLGDFCDRGDKSFQVIEFLTQLSKEFNCVFLKGNHEDMWLRFLTGGLHRDEYEMFFYNGGTSTLDSYCEHIMDDEGNPRKTEHGMNMVDLPQEHQDFYNNLKVFHEQDDFVFVHAGVRPNVPLDKQSTHDMIWIRDTFLRHPSEILEGKVVIHGHTPMNEGEISHYNSTHTDRKNLDTGCVFGYDLTCMNVISGVKYTQKRLDRRTS